MTVREVLGQGVSFLIRAEVDTPWLDACLLLGEVLGCGKERLVIRYPDEISEESLTRYRHLLKQRGDGQPVSYIRRKKEFYGLEFYVDERVLVPRPDTETLVEEAQTFLQKNPQARVLDLCTGSGCLAITLNHLFPQARVTGADISAGAADVFKRNALNLLDRPLPFILSDLFSNITETFELIVSNPPYIEREEAEMMKESGWPEPLLALDGGENGTDFLMRIIDSAWERLVPGGILMLEADTWQIKKCEQKMRQSGYINIGTRNDLGGRLRVVRGSRTND